MSGLTVGLFILSHVLIGGYFAFLGCWNIYHWAPILKVMSDRGIPHPYFALSIGIGIQTITGFMIAFGTFVPIASLILIPSTILAMWLFHPFWHFKGETRALNFAIFMANMTVTLGALILLFILPDLINS